MQKIKKGLKVIATILGVVIFVLLLIFIWAGLGFGYALAVFILVLAVVYRVLVKASIT